MGSWHRFRCNRCGYEAEVSGGPDAGMVVSTQTMTCEDCQNLVDVIVGIQAFVTHEQERLGPAIGRCPKCRRKAGLELWGRTEMIDVWATGDEIGDVWGPCPRCDGAMAFGGEVALWD